HGLLLCLAVIFSIIACSLSVYLMFRHATSYSQPKAQKQIIRILLMVPVYTIACTLSIQFYKKNVYIASVYEFYESLVIAAFFLLLCRYLHFDLESLQRAFILVEPKPWIHPIRFFVVYIGRNKKGRTEDGQKWFNIIWVGVFQFCVIKALGALIKCITEAAGVYCEESNNASHAKIWIMVIEILSLVTAMLSLLQFYKQTKLELAPHRPLLKFVAIKLVIFLFYVQSFIFNMLTKEGGAIKPSAKFSYPSWAVGVPNALLCMEMAVISVLHLWAYPWDLYRPSQPSVLIDYGGFLGWRAFVDALNFIDLLQSVARAFYWLFVQRRRNKTAQGLGQMQNEHYNDMGRTGRSKLSSLSEALAAIEQTPHELQVRR
ncbi:organic solute transporter Ostalpha-domain-containing protein, partial [Bisporella sp. PMI_857]